MTAAENPRKSFQLGTAGVDPDRNVLTRDGQEWRVEPKVMDVLCALAERQGHVVSRATLIERFWVSEYGADEALTRAVSRLRSALREIDPENKAIETVPKRGYRLLLPVAALAGDPVGETEAAKTAAVPAAQVANRPSWWRLPVVILVLLAGALALWRPWNQPSPDNSVLEDRTVVVLPFKPLSDDESDRFFGQGIAEELLNALDQFPELRVIARTSAFNDDPALADSQSRARQLGANHIVTGSVRRSQERIRISAQLLRVADMSSLWSNTYEFDAKDLFAVEDEIVRELAQTLQVRLGIGAQIGRSDGGGIDQAAYDQYLTGLRLWGDRMRKNDNREQALAAFQRAVAFDEAFADAWAGLGTVAVYSVGSPLSRDREQFTRMTEEALNKAIALDSRNARAHAALAVFHVTQRINIDSAREHLAEAQSVAPHSAATQYASFFFHRVLGDAESALAALEKTIVLDPLNTVLTASRASLLFSMGRIDEGMAFYEECFNTSCLGEGFIAFAGTAAAFTGEARYMQRWLPRVDEFEALIERIPASKKPNVATLMPAFTSVRYDRDDKEAQIARMRSLFAESLMTDTIGLWGPTFAEFLPVETMTDALHLAYERGDLFAATYSLSPLYGINPWPPQVLAHPRYHELWQRPGMPQLAAQWRARGQIAGLPIDH